MKQHVMGHQHTEKVLSHLVRIYSEGRRGFACRATNRRELEEWQKRVKPRLRELMGLDLIAGTNRDHGVPRKL